MLIAALACAACGSDDEKAESEEDEDEPTGALVETIELETVSFDERIELTGVTEPIVAATLAPEIGGRIDDVRFEEGERVEAGDVLAVMDTSGASARASGVRVQVRQLDRDVERTKKLLERGLATRADLEALQTRRDVLKKQIGEIRVGKKQGVTRAPISGIATERNAEPGEYARGGEKIGRIVDIDTITVDVGLPENEIRFVEEGQSVDVVIEALGKRFPGVLDQVGLEANPKNRTFPLEIHVPNPDIEIRSGMRATVSLMKRRHENAVVVPRDAVLQAIDGSEVFIVDENQAVARSIELGPGLVRYVVVEDGLDAGDELIIRGHRSLVQGAAVNVVETEPCCSDQLDAYMGETLHDPDTSSKSTRAPTPAGTDTEEEDPSEADGARASVEGDGRE